MPSQWMSYSSKTYNQGFSLIELMIVLVIIAITAAVAVPNYQSSRAASQLSSAANNLLGALQFARSEAVVRRSEITVCPTSDQTSCSGSWNQGVLVLAGNTALRVFPASEGISITGNQVKFKGNGQVAAASNLQLTKDSKSKTIAINIVGHAKIN